MGSFSKRLLDVADLLRSFLTQRKKVIKALGCGWV